MKAIRSILAISLLYTSACSDGEQDVNLSCAELAVGKSCSSANNGGMIYVDTSVMKSGQEYILVAKSNEKPGGTENLDHPLTVRSDVGSDSPDSAEAYKIQTVIRRQRGSLNFAPAELDENIRIGRQNVGDRRDFYVPSAWDYVTRLENKIVPFFVHQPNGRVSGTRKSFTSAASFQDLYELHFDANLENSNILNMTQNLDLCLQRVFPPTMAILGRPISVDGNPRVNILITLFEGALGSRTLGLFSPIDRFLTNGSARLTDSNYSQNISVSPTQDAGRACSTAAHEYQHLRSFDAKVLSQIPENRRSNMAAKKELKLSEEDQGLDEGLAHIFESLTGEVQRVDEHVYNFFTQPHLATFALEGSYSNNLGNSRTRGLNTLFLYFVIKLAGARLDIGDPSLQSILSRIVLSPKIGISNIAEMMGTTERDLMAQFITNLLYSLYDSGTAASFLPPIESNLTSSGIRVNRGVQILDRNSSIESLTYIPPSIHPYQFDMKFLSLSDDNIMPSQGLAFYRFIVPSTLPRDSEVSFSTRGKNFSVFVVRVR